MATIRKVKTNLFHSNSGVNVKGKGFIIKLTGEEISMFDRYSIDYSGPINSSGGEYVLSAELNYDGGLLPYPVFIEHFKKNIEDTNWYKEYGIYEDAKDQIKQIQIEHNKEITKIKNDNYIALSEQLLKNDKLEKDLKEEISKNTEAKEIVKSLKVLKNQGFDFPISS